MVPHGTRWSTPCGLAMLAYGSIVHAQRPMAAPVTDLADQKFITAQTRKQGGPMPAEQLALEFEHLDHALR